MRTAQPVLTGFLRAAVPGVGTGSFQGPWGLSPWQEGAVGLPWRNLRGCPAALPSRGSLRNGPAFIPGKWFLHILSSGVWCVPSVSGVSPQGPHHGRTHLRTLRQRQEGARAPDSPGVPGGAHVCVHGAKCLREGSPLTGHLGS